MKGRSGSRANRVEGTSPRRGMVFQDYTSFGCSPCGRTSNMAAAFRGSPRERANAGSRHQVGGGAEFGIHPAFRRICQRHEAAGVHRPHSRTGPSPVMDETFGELDRRPGEGSRACCRPSRARGTHQTSSSSRRLGGRLHGGHGLRPVLAAGRIPTKIDVHAFPIRTWPLKSSARVSGVESSS